MIASRRYHLVGNLHMVQTFTIFVDDLTTTKNKTMKVVIAQLVPPYEELFVKMRTGKISSGAFGCIFMKVCTNEN